VKHDDERWRNGQIQAAYQEKLLTVTVDAKAFLADLKKTFGVPKSFDHGVIIFNCDIKLPPEVVEKIIKEPEEGAASTIDSSPSSSSPPTSSVSTNDHPPQPDRSTGVPVT
jgi:hypothetical protein